MKKFLLLSLACIVVMQLHSQKKDRESMGMLGYVQNPEEPLSQDFKTYSIDAEGASGDDYRTDEIMGKFSFAGYERVEQESDADVQFFLKEYSLQEGERESKTKKTVVKKDGVEETVTTYYYINSFKYKYVLTMRDKLKQTIFEQEYSGVRKVAGDDMSTYKAALSDYKSEMADEKGKILSEGVGALVKAVNDKHGFPLYRLSAVGFKIKPKKFDYTELNNAFELLKAAVKTSNENNQDISLVEEDLKKVIAVCEKEIATLEDHKKARMNPKATAAAYYNITMAYAILKQYDKALEALTKGRELDKGIGDAVYIENLMTKLAKRSKTYADFLAAK